MDINARSTEDGRVIVTGTDGREHDITSNELLGAEARRVQAEQDAETAARRAAARTTWKARFGG